MFRHDHRQCAVLSPDTWSFSVALPVTTSLDSSDYIRCSLLSVTVRPAKVLKYDGKRVGIIGSRIIYYIAFFSTS